MPLKHMFVAGSRGHCQATERTIVISRFNGQPLPVKVVATYYESGVVLEHHYCVPCGLRGRLRWEGWKLVLGCVDQPYCCLSRTNMFVLWTWSYRTTALVIIDCLSMLNFACLFFLRSLTLTDTNVITVCCCALVKHIFWKSSETLATCQLCL